MFHFDVVWQQVMTGLQDFVAGGILDWITGVLGGLLPPG